MFKLGHNNRALLAGLLIVAAAAAVLGITHSPDEVVAASPLHGDDNTAQSTPPAPPPTSPVTEWHYRPGYPAQDDSIELNAIPDVMLRAFRESRPADTLLLHRDDVASIFEHSGGGTTATLRAATTDESVPETLRAKATIAGPFSITAESTTSVSVAWTDPGRYASGASIYRDGTLVARLLPGRNSFTDPDLTPNTRYAYRIEGQLSNGDTETTEFSIVTLASVPEVAIPMARAPGQFSLAITNAADPSYTEYRVAVLDPSRGFNPVTVTDWSNERCVRIDGLAPGRTYQLAAQARNLDGIQTASPTHVAGEPAWTDLRVWTPPALPVNDAWAEREINAAADIYGLTDDARDWLLTQVQVSRMVGEPGWAGAWDNNLGIGHPDPWTLMHEAMHIFWSYWDGFPESCDRMNLHTFRRDVAIFMEVFSLFDNLELDNPFEPWRPYYQAMVQHLPEEIAGEKTSVIIANEEFYKLWDYLYHVHETNAPAYAAQKMSLIPPILRRYYVGFLKDGPESNWQDESNRNLHLRAVDRDLWLLGYGRLRVPRLNQDEYPDVNRAFRTGQLPEPVRTQLRDADRRKLVDFFNTLPDVDGNGYFNPCRNHNPDQGFGQHYIRSGFQLSLRYLDDLADAEGAELTDEQYQAALNAWRVIFNGPLYSEQAREQALQTLDATPGLPEGYGTAFANIVAMIGKYEYSRVYLEPSFGTAGAFDAVRSSTAPSPGFQDGPRNVVVMVDQSNRIRIEWDAPSPEQEPTQPGFPPPSPSGETAFYRTNISYECDTFGETFDYSAPYMEELNRNRVTYSPAPSGTYQVCIGLTIDGIGREVCHQNVVIP